MKPDPAAPADQLNLLRQQLILAQVRIMELEDTRDELDPKLKETAFLLATAQALADTTLEESAHLTRVLADLQAQFEHQRHLTHQAHEALQRTRSQLDEAGVRLAATDQRCSQLQTDLGDLAAQATRLNQNLDRLGLELAAATTLAGARLERVNQVDAELQAMKASRSWRWMAWLRSIERATGGRK
jgi:chromosome segregation ATPase